MKHRALAAALCALMIMTACQPTPEQEIVHYKGGGDLQAVIEGESAAPYRYEAPDSWAENMEVRGNEVIINASITLPDTDRYPVMILEKQPFSESVTSYMTALFGDGILLRDQEENREELELRLAAIRRGSFSEIDEETGQKIFVPYPEQEENIERLERLIAETPAEETYTPMEEFSGLPWVTYYKAVDSEGYLTCSERYYSICKDYSCLIQPEYRVELGEALPGEPPHKLEGIRIEEAEARNIAEYWMTLLGQKDRMILFSAVRSRSVDSYSMNNAEPGHEFPDSSVSGEGYVLTYVPNECGMLPFAYDDYTESVEIVIGSDGAGETAYSARWAQEFISFFITERGVVWFGWYDPHRTVGTANENVRLLPFEELQKSIRDLLQVGIWGYHDETIYISRLTLSAVMHRIPDEQDQAYLLPAWIIELTTDTDLRWNNPPNILMVNAIDGSYISSWGW